MPTSHVLPGSAELLQDIADALWKAKKVLVVTGAGISTNSGIPDFRSRNGLYSLIQAQFDAAATGDDAEPDNDDDNGSDARPAEPAEPAEPVEPVEPVSKRRRVAKDDRAPTRRSLRRLGSTMSDRDGSTSNSTSNSRCSSPASQSDHIARARSQRHSRRSTPSEAVHCAPSEPADDDRSSVVVLPALNPKRFAEPMRTPQRRTRASILAASDSVDCLRSHPMSSSPLSSPPSVLFDPSEPEPSEHYRSATSACSSDVESDDADDKADADAASSSQSIPLPALSSQSSFASNKGTLTTMKGRDLFDASIWADPVKTSVFYTFATTLRQKVRDVVPTRSHEFISHLRDTNKLVRCYTQNIDEIEEKVGLSTSLYLGPGKKGRFSTRSLSRMSSGSTVGKDCSQDDAKDVVDAKDVGQESSSQEEADTKKAPLPRDASFRGVECVFLHGSLRQLRCFRCGQTTPWDEDGREHETMSGRQPSCPRCAGATAAREGRGKRALAVGKLRPDIVLYGEEHPNAHLISPIVQHDLSLAPDMLLILGTSLKVHGLKVLVREFSKAVHNRGGTVVFVNFTKPPESVWSDIIDYWVQWDCDAWVQDLKEKKPIMWMPPGTVPEEPKPAKPKKTKEAKEAKEAREKRKNAGELTISIDISPESVPAEDTIVVEKEGKKERRPKSSTAEASPEAPEARTDTEAGDAKKKRAPRKRKPRHSAPAEMEIVLADRVPPPLSPQPRHETPVPLPTLRFLQPKTCAMDPQDPRENDNAPKPLAEISANIVPTLSTKPGSYSILSAVKANPRRRRTKKIFEGGGGVPAQASEPKQQHRKKAVGTSATATASRSRGRSKSMGGNPMDITALLSSEPSSPVKDESADAWSDAWSGTDRIAEQLMNELKAFSESPARLSQRPHVTHATHVTHPTVLPPFRQHFADHFRPPWTHSVPATHDPLCAHYGYPPPWPQEWSCADQLEREADERAADERFRLTLGLGR